MILFNNLIIMWTMVGLIFLMSALYLTIFCRQMKKIRL